MEPGGKKEQKMVEETRESKTKASGTSDEAVRRRTGRGWQEWFEILDRAGAKEMDHKSIVAYLNENHALSSWWQQQVTVTYEQERGLRKVHQMADGYQISRSKTINVPLSDLYAAWEDEDRRGRWLGGASFEVRTSRTGKSIRMTWDQPGGIVDVSFSSKRPDKSQLTVQHSKLKSPELAKEMKIYWAEALKDLKAYLEAGE
jgi:uncharacterized protein YndB with AHSA1/START domain